VQVSWFLLALLTALFYGAQSAYLKGVLAEVDKLLVAWGIFAFALPIFVGMLAFEGLPAVAGSFYWALGVSLGVNVIAWPLFVRAVQISDISLVMPLVALTPVFVIGVEFVLLGELPSGTGLWGILLITLGAYVLNINRQTAGLLEPLTSLASDRGALYMLLVAALWSVSATVEKIAVGSSSPDFYLTSLGLGFSLVFVVVLAFRVEAPLKNLRTHWLKLAGAGILTGLMAVFQMRAIAETPLVNYVISIKRAGMLVSVLAGWLIFGEENILFRAFGAVLMIAGVVLIRMV
jgi:drug/metabolite transporter (DMT)-like permease